MSPSQRTVIFRDGYRRPWSTRAEPGPLGKSSRKVDFHTKEELPEVKTVDKAVLGGGYVHAEARELSAKETAENIPSLKVG